MPVSRTKPLAAFAALTLVTIAALYSAQYFGGSPASVLEQDGSLPEIVIQGVPVVYGGISHGQTVEIPEGRHGIITCPTGEPPEESEWLGPSSLSAPGLMIYEYTDGFYAEKNATVAKPERWIGRSFAYDVPDTLSLFKAGGTYHVKADTAMMFACSSGSYVPSSSSPPHSESSSSPSAEDSSHYASSSCNSRELYTFGELEPITPFQCDVHIFDPEDGRATPLLQPMPCDYTVRVGDTLEIPVQASSSSEEGLTNLMFSMSPYTEQCDANEDGRVDRGDLGAIVGWLNQVAAGGGHEGDPVEFVESYDVNQDGTITPLDALWLLNLFYRWTNDTSERISFMDGVLRWTPTEDHVGTYQIGISAFENTGQHPRPFSSIVVQIRVTE